MAKASPHRMLWRGFTKRCPRCGAGHLFSKWLELAPHCPRCGYRFEREEGFFLGAYVINLAISELAVVAVVVALVVREARGGHVSLLPWVVAAVGIQLFLPILAYPFSKTIWSAFDLIMRPLEPSEEAEAILRRQGDGGPTTGK